MKNESSFIEHNKETEHVKEINAMQMELMSEWGEERDGDENTIAMEWIQKYSKKFRDVLDNILDQETYFWDDLKSDLFKGRIMDRIKEELYEENK